MDYKITYSARKTIGIYVHRDASVEVRCPLRTSRKVIEEIVNSKKKWIDSSREKILNTVKREFDEVERNNLIKKGKDIIPKKVAFFSKIMGVNPVSIKIGNAKSYWGCCSGSNRITFSWRLMQASSEVIDYVIVHELAHIKEHNHSKRFWSEVERVLPDYRRRLAELKKLD